jgi:hypothetical protein
MADSAASNASKKITWSNIATGIMAKITGLTAKTTLVDADQVIINDSAASSVPKKITWANFVIAIMGKITALTTKVTPVAADAVVITDSAASDVPKRVTFTNLIAYLTTLFADLTTTQTITGTKNFSSVTATSMVASTFRSYAQSIADDGVFVIPTTAAGFIMVSQSSDITALAFGYFRAPTASLTAAIHVGSNAVFTTGVLTGTTGTDGKMTISTNDSNLYIENRRGATRTYTITLFA